MCVYDPLWQLCFYEENYEMALAGFTRATALDPGWSVPRDKMADMKHFLQAMTQNVSSKVRCTQHDTLCFIITVEPTIKTL